MRPLECTCIPQGANLYQVDPHCPTHGEVVTVKGHILLTGTQWYDRFERELMGTKFRVLEAARKAAGLE